MGLIMNSQIHKVFSYRETGAIIVRCAYFFHKLYSLSLSSLNDKIQNLVYVFTIININYPTAFPNMLICFIDTELCFKNSCTVQTTTSDIYSHVRCIKSQS